MVTIDQGMQNFLYKQTHIRICCQWHVKQWLQEWHGKRSIELSCLILCANLKKFNVLPFLTYENNVMFSYAYICPLSVKRLPELITRFCQAHHGDIWLTSQGSSFVTSNSRYLPQDITTNQNSLLSQLSPSYLGDRSLTPALSPFMKGSCNFYRFIKWFCSKTVKWHNTETAT